MKKIILLMLMLSPFANADMDNICMINAPRNVDIYTFIASEQKDFPNMKSKIDEVGCERNNILLFEIARNHPKSDLSLVYFQYVSALWCRHDRNEKVEKPLLRCVLYDTKPRKFADETISKD